MRTMKPDKTHRWLSPALVIPYERGFQHGSHFADKIRSFYATIVDTSLVPFLNHEHKNVASFLEENQKPLYADGQFSYHTLLQSGK